MLVLCVSFIILKFQAKKAQFARTREHVDEAIGGDRGIKSQLFIQVQETFVETSGAGEEPLFLDFSLGAVLLRTGLFFLGVFRNDLKNKRCYVDLEAIRGLEDLKGLMLDHLTDSFYQLYLPRRAEERRVSAVLDYDLFCDE